MSIAGTVSKPVVGLVGLGAMGRGVAGNLISKGFTLVGHDVRPEMREWLTERGGTASRSTAAVFTAAQARVAPVPPTVWPRRPQARA